MQEGKTKMQKAREMHTSILTRSKALQQHNFIQPPPDTSSIDEEEEKNDLFEFDSPEWEKLPFRGAWDTKRNRLFTKKNCVCASPCHKGKCKVQPELCGGYEEDKVEFCENDEEDVVWKSDADSSAYSQGSNDKNKTRMDTSQ